MNPVAVDAFIRANLGFRARWGREEPGPRHNRRLIPRIDCAMLEYMNMSKGERDAFNKNGGRNGKS